MNPKVLLFVLSVFGVFLASFIGWTSGFSFIETLIFIGQLVLFIAGSLGLLLFLFWIGIKLFGDK